MSTDLSIVSPEYSCPRNTERGDEPRGCLSHMAADDDGAVLQHQRGCSRIAEKRGLEDLATAQGRVEQRAGQPICRAR